MIKWSAFVIVTVKEYSIYSINRSSILPPNADEIFEKVFELTCDELLASLKQMSSLDKMVRC